MIANIEEELYYYRRHPYRKSVIGKKQQYLAAKRAVTEAKQRRGIQELHRPGLLRPFKLPSGKFKFQRYSI